MSEPISDYEAYRNEYRDDTIWQELHSMVSNDTESQGDDRITNVPGDHHKSADVMAFLVGLTAAVGGFLYGYDTGVINSLLEMNYFKSKFASNEARFTAVETSIMTASLSLGAFCGALSAPLTSDSWGRRWSIIIATLIFFNIGTIIQTVAYNIAMIAMGRFISGLAVGIISAVVPLYQAEASPKNIRGSIISLYQWSITWGLLCSSAVAQGTHDLNDSRSFRIPIALQFFWSALLTTGMYVLPESPRYYVSKDQLDKAIASLSRLRRLPWDSEELIEELIEIKASRDYEKSFGEARLIDCFRSSPSRHKQGFRIMTATILQALQQCSGINFIFYYGVNFFMNTGVDTSYLMSFITYAVNVVLTIPGIMLVEVIGRRKLLLSGAAGMSVSNLIIGIVGTVADSVIVNKVMIAFVCSFIAFFASTWGPCVWVVSGECFPLSVRQKSMALSSATNWFVNFVFAYCTPYLVDTGNHTAALGTNIFFIWGGCNFLGLIFTYFCVYETKGLLLEEIDLMYKHSKFAWKSSEFKSILEKRVLERNNLRDHEIGEVVDPDQDEGEDTPRKPKSSNLSSSYGTSSSIDRTDFDQEAETVPLPAFASSALYGENSENFLPSTNTASHVPFEINPSSSFPEEDDGIHEEADENHMNNNDPMHESYNYSNSDELKDLINNLQTTPTESSIRQRYQGYQDDNDSDESSQNSYTMQA
ncbi:Plasma membrane low glucose sensor [Komagataella phaffii CBS 7435]|uniref:Plasma membrane low glucose sensor n=1 Tax=Komagataella phaffii (strain ATCC 76273 / CBS 7435 / CECT 11047 / NRRL Y-11430 / Wegner 21-1) TaxID=981350 RepID=F2QP27_KOMPC|nr:GQ67_02885T0 [Komagataella phaffii]AOA65806.1 GQ68_02362T0 [Komagataella phaffii GS115]CAH2446435.1 Plasma membrane low glucose sensor [Komagataella phaffii CBS 7435]CCA36769.1 Plasma membrane low glucose sensor [Komagataella phaffii CBS 7435]